MKIRRFQAPNMRTALVEVQEVLGTDAVIISSKQIETGVEVMAASDYDESIFQVKPKDEIPANIIEGPRARATIQLDKATHSDPSYQMMKEHIQNLESLLQEHLSYQKWKAVEINSPAKAEVIRKLIQKGFDVSLIQAVLKDISNETYFEIAWKEAQRLLAERITVQEDPILNQPGIYAFVGSTGVGKTTTVAKLAAHAALRGDGDVGLITTDTYRIAARDQLGVYAKILNIPLAVADTMDQYELALQRFKRKKVILIDTAGFSHSDKRVAQQIRFLQAAPNPVHVVSILAANTDARVQKAITNQFKNLGIQQAVLTKLDEQTCLGEQLSLCIEQALTLTYVCNGQRVPEDMSQARAHELVKLACQSKDIQPSQEAMEKMAVAAGVQKEVNYE